MEDCADLELTFHKKGVDEYFVEFRFHQPGSQTDNRMGGGISSGNAPVVSLPDTLFTEEHLLDLTLYGKTLTDTLFSSPDLKMRFANACTVSESHNIPLRIRLWFATDAARLHDIAWETLQHPLTYARLGLGDNYYLSRYLSSDNWRKTELPALGSLKALVVVANPSGLEKYNLAPIQVTAEIARARQGLGNIATTVLASAESGQPATFNNLLSHLREEYDILYLVCHGLMANDQGWVWLEDEQKNIARHSAVEISAGISSLRKPPVLVVLVSCQSAGNLKENSAGRAMRALGPQLLDAGIPAVLAMQTNLNMGTASQFMPVFLGELLRDGQIDRALAVARSRVLKQNDWWAPVLFSRLIDNRLFSVPPGPQVEQGFKALAELINSSPEIRASASESRTDFETACQQIIRLANYKDLHDLLHVLQFDFYALVISPAGRFPDDETAEDELLVHETKLDEIVNDLRKILERPAVNPSEKLWAQKIENAQKNFTQAIEQSDPVLLKRSLDNIKFVIGNQPTKINGLLTEAARALHLDVLIAVLKNLNQLVQTLDHGSAVSVQFEDGLKNLDFLNVDLNAQVAAHDHWQAVENELRGLEGSIEKDLLDELKSSWLDVKTTALELYRDIEEYWARKLIEDSAALDQAILDDNPKRIKQAFRKYRSRIGRRFFDVDTNLKELCGEIKKIGPPLDDVIRKIK